MANHARDNRGIEDKRSALAGGQHRAYSHSDQVGGTRRREADGRWVDRGPEPEPPKPQPLSRQSFGEFVKNNMVYILSAAAVVAIGLLLLFGVRAFSGAPSSSGAGTSGTGSADPENYVSPYDWSKLDTSTNHYAYVVDGKVKSSLGVDVAEYQGDIDWNAAAADGIDFAIIRLGYRGATEGDIHLDEQYYDNLAEARAAGLDVGVYFFSQATTPEEAREEGFPELAEKFELVGGVEARHEERYLQILRTLEEGKTFKSDDENTVWICRNCGAVIVGKEAPEVCPVCAHPQAYFERRAENY